MVYAQESYKRCLDGEKIRWTFLENAIDRADISREFIAYGDTLINNAIYKKIYENDLFYINFYNNIKTDEDWITENWDNNRNEISPYHNVFIRESEDASKLYILYDYYTSKEYLVSDLSLQEGDEFQIPASWGGQFVLVDSVYVKNGLKHVQLDYEVNLVYEWGKLTFVEGVGPNVFFMHPDIYGNSATHCFQNQIGFYQMELKSFEDFPCGYCVPYASIEKNLAKEYDLIIEENRITLDFYNQKDRQISIYDISGQLKYNRDFSLEKNITISRSSFQKGIYILKILDKKDSKLMINKIVL